MEAFFGVLALAFVAVVLLGPWILIVSLRQRLNEHTRQFEQRVGDVVRRLYEAETALRKLEQAASPAATVTRAVEPTAPPTQATAPTPPPNIAEEPSRPEPSSAPLPYIPPRPASPPLPKVETASLQLPPQPEPHPTLVDRIRNSGGIEELLGKNWLNKVGIVLLVMGVAFFLAYQLKTMGPTGKIFVGYTVSLALLGAGM